MNAQESDRKIDIMARECLGMRMRALNRVVTQIYDRALLPLGLKASQLNVLVAAGKFGLARPLEVCRVLRLDASTLSRNVERMKTKGWLESADDEDARSQPFRLTASGKRLLERAMPAWERAQRKAGLLLGEKGMALLNDVTKNLNRGNENRR